MGIKLAKYRGPGRLDGFHGNYVMILNELTCSSRSCHPAPRGAGHQQFLKANPIESSAAKHSMQSLSVVIIQMRLQMHSYLSH